MILFLEINLNNLVSETNMKRFSIIYAPNSLRPYCRKDTFFDKCKRCLIF